MMLGASASGAKPACPWHFGEAVGTKAGTQVREGIEWQVDTGAECSAIKQSIGVKFDSIATAFTASPTTGGGGIRVVTGIDVTFTVEDEQGNSRQVQSSRYVAIKPSDACSNLLGMAQLESACAEVRWDPASRTGSLRV